MNLNEAWQKYLADVEEVRQMFLTEPMIRERPETEAAAITLLHQTIAISYNLVMAPKQDHPVFLLQNYLDPIVYLGHLPCPDFTYRIAFLNGARTWRIRGKRNTSHWIDLQLNRGWWGEPDGKCMANYDLDQFAIEPDGAFEIIASAERQAGNWIELDPTSGNNVLLIRQSNYDWEREVMVELDVVPDDDQPSAPMILNAAEVCRRLDLAGRMMKHCVKIWTAPASRRLLKYAPMNELVVRSGDGDRGANPLAQYGQGLFELADDEALIIETAVPDAKYWSIQLGNWWWETLDYTHHKSSINGAQAAIDSDGRFRCVIAHSDPGVPNWLDPVGWRTGLIMLRWYRATTELAVTTRKVPLSMLREHLPSDTPSMNPAQRATEIEARRRGSLRRYGY